MVVAVSNFYTSTGSHYESKLELSSKQLLCSWGGARAPPQDAHEPFGRLVQARLIWRRVPLVVGPVNTLNDPSGNRLEIHGATSNPRTAPRMVCQHTVS